MGSPFHEGLTNLRASEVGGLSIFDGEPCARVNVRFRRVPLDESQSQIRNPQSPACPLAESSFPESRIGWAEVLPLSSAMSP